MQYDERMADQRDRLPREDAAESHRMRREARTAFSKAARTMRRRVTVTIATTPTREIIQHAGVILEPAGLFLSRADVERMAAEVAADYCGAGALVLPATHADAATHIRPASDAELWAILDRRISGRHHTAPACRCHDCEAIRATPFTCGACGFHGEPIVFPCDCGEQWDGTVNHNAAMLQDKTIAGTERRKIEEWQRKLLAGGRYPMCSTADPMCAHGAAVCPVCGDSGSDDPFSGDEEPREVAAMLRDLRTALRSRAVP